MTQADMKNLIDDNRPFALSLEDYYTRLVLQSAAGELPEEDKKVFAVWQEFNRLRKHRYRCGFLSDQQILAEQARREIKDAKIEDRYELQRRQSGLAQERKNLILRAWRAEGARRDGETQEQCHARRVALANRSPEEFARLRNL